jgi:hypothetical protein
LRDEINLLHLRPPEIRRPDRDIIWQPNDAPPHDRIDVADRLELVASG